MSIGSIMSNLFGGGTANAAPAPQQMPQPGNFPTAPTPGMASDPNNVNAPAASTNAQATATTPAPEGLDKFNDLWKPVESPAGDPAPSMFNVKPEQLMDAARKIDFTKVMNPQQLQAVAQGGEGAVTAMAQIMNTVAQTVYAQNAHATTKIVEQAVNQAKEAMRSELPQHIKLQNVSESIRTSNPALNHPAAAPIMGALQQQLTLKYPNATAAEISTMATDYLSNFASQFAPKAPQQSKTDAQAAGNFDWDAWANPN